jgi:hypothetical protein
MDYKAPRTASSGRGLGASALEAQGRTLVSVYDWAFQFGPGLVMGRVPVSGVRPVATDALSRPASSSGHG